MRSSKNILLSDASQENFTSKEMSIVGHWPSGSQVHERYGRRFRANEALLRKTLMAIIATGWEMVPSPHIPRNVNPRERIGKIPEEVPNDAKLTTGAPAGFHVGETAHYPSRQAYRNQDTGTKTQTIAADPIPPLLRRWGWDIRINRRARRRTTSAFRRNATPPRT